MKKALIYGYGNPGRKDDGLGVLCADEIEKWAKAENHDWLSVDTAYQLNIEDAEVISNFDVVYFVDASLEEIEDVILSEISPNNAKIEFSMHAVSPAYVVELCQQMFGKKPKAFLIHIKGYHWDFVEGITAEAQVNLDKAVRILKEKLTIH